MAFPSITKDTALNDLALAKVVWYACLNRLNARRAARGDDAWFPSDVDEDFFEEPSKSTRFKWFIENAQQFVLSVFSGFVDPELELEGSPGLSWSNHNLTYSRFKELTGLTNDGLFRRISEDATPPSFQDWESYDWSGYEYGKVEPLDVAGPWLWADLFSALEKLTRVHGTRWATTSGYTETGFGDSESLTTYTGRPVLGNVDFADDNTSRHNIVLSRIDYTTVGWWTSDFVLYFNEYEQRYLHQDDVTANNMLVAKVAIDGVLSGSILGITSADNGKSVVREATSTRVDEDNNGWFSAAFGDHSELLGMSRDLLISTAIGGWEKDVQKYCNVSFSDLFLVSDYEFPDGETGSA